MDRAPDGSAEAAVLDEDASTGDTLLLTADSPAPAEPGATPPAVIRRKRTRKPVRRALVRLHRWLSFGLGIGLLVITTTGAALVYEPEWTVWSNADVFDVTATDDPIPVQQALDIVDRAHPEFGAASVNVQHDLYWVASADSVAHPGFYGVDPGTGEVTGFADTSRGVMALMVQVHECFFSCEGYPAYLPFLADPVPTLGISWLTDMTWSAVVLGVGGLLLLFLGVSGLWLWWPTIAKFSRGFRVRRGKGRYARDFDLHQLVGLVAAPFLLMWGLTGAGFEFPFVGTVWYAATGGEQPAEETPFVSADAADDAPDIGMTAAIAAAQAEAGSAARLVSISLPAADDPTATYSFWFDHGHDQYAHGSYPGEYLVTVDRHDADRLQPDDYGQAETLSNQLYDSWGAAMFHYGISVNGWWRIIWFAFGLSPLFLAVTGISTWLAKRTVRRSRAQAQAGVQQSNRAPDERRAQPVS